MIASFLVDLEIKDAVKQGTLCIEDPGGRKLINPADGQPARDSGLDAHGYILHARRILTWREGNGHQGGWFGFRATEREGNGRRGGWIDLKSADKYTLSPKESIIIETYERLSLSPHICSTIHSLARLTLLGLSHISTTVHPGWGKNGPQPFRIAVSNLGDLHIDVLDKEPIARMLFYHSVGMAETAAPTPDEVFQRAENAFTRHKAAAATKQRLMRISYLVLCSLVFLFIAILFAEGFSLAQVFKAAALGLVTLWSALIFRKMTD